jgi:hypothetical protein
MMKIEDNKGKKNVRRRQEKFCPKYSGIDRER